MKGKHDVGDGRQGSSARPIEWQRGGIVGHEEQLQRAWQRTRGCAAPYCSQPTCPYSQEGGVRSCWQRSLHAHHLRSWAYTRCRHTPTYRESTPAPHPLPHPAPVGPAYHRAEQCKRELAAPEPHLRDLGQALLVLVHQELGPELQVRVNLLQGLRGGGELRHAPKKVGAARANGASARGRRPLVLRPTPWLRVRASGVRAVQPLHTCDTPASLPHPTPSRPAAASSPTCW